MPSFGVVGERAVRLAVKRGSEAVGRAEKEKGKVKPSVGVVGGGRGSSVIAEIRGTEVKIPVKTVTKSGGLESAERSCWLSRDVGRIPF